MAGVENSPNPRQPLGADLGLGANFSPGPNFRSAHSRVCVLFSGGKAHGSRAGVAGRYFVWQHCLFGREIRMRLGRSCGRFFQLLTKAFCVNIDSVGCVCEVVVSCCCVCFSIGCEFCFVWREIRNALGAWFWMFLSIYWCLCASILKTVFCRCYYYFHL